MALGLMSLGTQADRVPLTGYEYKTENAPTGKEWEDCQQLALNKEQPHAWFFSFESVQSARNVLPERSAYHLSLDGNWKFHWVGNPSERPEKFYEDAYDVSGWDEIPVPCSWQTYGVQKDGSHKYGTPIYVNQPVIFMHRVAVDDWKGGVMRTPPQNWSVYTNRNEVGSYRRTFTIPTSWDGRQVFINFDGVDSFFYIWINGHYVGFSKNSRNLASFNITRYLRKGENQVAVEVYRSSDGSFLESQDMFRLSGIYRSVSLTSTPAVHVRDLVAIPDLDSNYRDGSLNITADVRNLSGKPAEGYSMSYSLYSTPLYDDRTTPVEGVGAETKVPAIATGHSTEAQATLNISSPDKWTSETPYRYVLVGQLKDKRGNVVETVSTYVGFRKVEIKDTPASEDEFGLAGRYYYVNGKTIKLKGVNRHENNPATGHYVTRKQMQNEVMLMLRANINHVRCSHYPDAPYWYYLCDKYGIYLEDEANIESHQYYYGKASLSHPKEWEAAHVARNMEMVHSDINHPSIVIWSLGNEAGPGDNFVAAYNAIKKFDTSRPVQYERNNKIVDMGSNQYPSIGQTRDMVTGKNSYYKYPFHISEYAHSMGNACGNLVDYWEAIESTNYVMGGAIWDWVDQAQYTYDPQTGTRYLGYGGDFGDTPNDGMFCMNGIMFPELNPKPQYFEVKKVYQYVGVKAVNMEKGQIEIFNKSYFQPLQDRFNAVWSLYADGREVLKSTDFGAPVNVGPRERRTFTLPLNYASLEAGKEYFVKVQFCLKNQEPWAAKGYVQAEEQLPVKAATGLPTLTEESKATTGAITVDEQKDRIVLKGENFTLAFDNAGGSIDELTYGGSAIFVKGNGPKLDAFRAPTDNDNWARNAWVQNGLHNLQHKVLRHSLSKRADGSVVVTYTIESQAPNEARLMGGNSGKNSFEEKTDKPFGEKDFKFTTNQVWTVYKDGSVELHAAITSNNASLELARLGYELQVPAAYDNYTYYGRGPINNFADRKVGQNIELFSGKVKDQFVSFPKPQTMSNREDVRWCALTDKAGSGAVFVPTSGKMSASALPYSEQQLTLAAHPYQLPKTDRTYLHLDMAVTGLGGNSCGQGSPLQPDHVKAAPHTFGFIIRPAQSDLQKAASVKGSGVSPIMIERDKQGNVTLTSENPDEQICFLTASGKGSKSKAKIYKGAFNLHDGGTVTAWAKNNPQQVTTAVFAKVETVPVEVTFASSVESGEGDAKHLVDGNPNTYWHTMYSVTVANYPHWVELDAGSLKTLKGFTYLPRQDSRNGNIKTYKIETSTDGKTWATAIEKGTFENNQKEKRVTFSKPVKGRYVRFTALSSQDGQDFATGAELSILAE